ncbi:hypothetical protein [Dermatobacter hominis]|uniref:hypothetical protein n=1 Tax=Dermatobacter hominis TaxID=2884263 RepID=UPI001D12865A|nr:hypothetical protein [Dermatobacter hominis]UDY37469.1 hypothetical protein LH044_07975 [Dermatobacter hominis]
MTHRCGRGAGAIVALLVVITWSAPACVPGLTSPARDAGDYREKAASTAGAAASAVSTVELLVGAAVRDDAFGPYLSVAAGDAERDLDAASSTFGAILPPGEASVLLREELGPLLDAAQSHVAAARIAIRRGEPDDLPQIRRDLRADADALEAFEERTS